MPPFARDALGPPCGPRGGLIGGAPGHRTGLCCVEAAAWAMAVVGRGRGGGQGVPVAVVL